MLYNCFNNSFKPSNYRSMVLSNSLKCQSEFEEQLQQGTAKKSVLSDIAKNHQVVNVDKMTIGNPTRTIMLGNGIHFLNQLQQFVIQDKDTVPNARDMDEPEIYQPVGMSKVSLEVKVVGKKIHTEISQFLFT